MLKAFGLALLIVLAVDAVAYQAALNWVSWIQPTVGCVIFNGWPICF